MLIDAQSAPSNSNTQPWNVHLVGGTALQDLSAALIAEFDKNGINPDFTIDYGQGVHPQRSQALAAKMYGLLGIAREDKEARTEFVRENLRFFGAPHTALLFIPPMGDRIRAAFDQGTYAENFLLSLQAHGYRGVPQGMISLLAPTVREFLGVDEEHKLVTALTFGIADESSPVFNTSPGRAPLSETVTAHGMEGLKLD
ncbi:nitroreductase [Corynebacterium sp. HMSC056F09]|nr:nitroreductase [Corynebacterium sp. HMSC076G08]OFN36202.1 nitroreductase [Corynebacterium sp. HMSC072A04]OFO18911.1 nitroreductase [Corynebacterium sp. HMSC056F09]